MTADVRSLGLPPSLSVFCTSEATDPEVTSSSAVAWSRCGSDDELALASTSEFRLAPDDPISRLDVAEYCFVADSDTASETKRHAPAASATIHQRSRMTLTPWTTAEEDPSKRVS